MATHNAYPNPAQVKSICCLMLADIGDILVTTPTIAGFKARYPNAHITVIVRKHLAPLLENNPVIDQLLCYDQRNILTKILFLLRVLLKPVDLWVDLHTPTFNTVCSNHYIFKRNALIRRFARARFSVGYAMPEITALHTVAVPVPNEKQLSQENIVDTTLRLADIKQVGYQHKTLVVAAQDQQWAKQLLDESIASGTELIGLFFGSKQKVDIWPLEKQVALAKELLTQQPKIYLMLLGGTLEVEITKALIKALNDADQKRIINMVGQTTLGQTSALIRYCRVMVSTDSGPLHMTDALGVPLVALFSSKNYLPIWLPVKSPYRLINKTVLCAPCFQSVCNQPISCMAMIEVDEVVAGINTLLATKE